MSNDAITEFRQMVRGNADLEAAVAGLVSDTGEFDAAGAVVLGNRHGFSFTEEDVMTYDIGDELSDFELEMAAAGVSTCNSGGT